MQWLVKSVSSSFSKDLSHEAKAKDSTLKAKEKTNDFKIVLQDPRGRGLVLEDSNTAIKWITGLQVNISGTSKLQLNMI